MPAALHKSLLGPYAAKKNLANAAEQGQLQNGTRVFQGGKVMGEYGQMSRTWGTGDNMHVAGWKNFLNNYMNDADRSLGIDGIRRVRVPALNALLQTVDNDAKNLKVYLDALSGSAKKNKAPADVEAEIARISSDVRKAIEYHHTKPHPRLNISLMKVEALAKYMRKLKPNDLDKKSPEDLTEYELNYALTSQTTAEKEYAKADEEKIEQKGEQVERESMQNEQLFNTKNMGSATGSGAGGIFLMAIGHGSFETNNPYADANEMNLSGNLNTVVTDIKNNSGDKLMPYLKRFADARSYLSTEQTARLAAIFIAQAIGLRTLSLQMSKIWGLNSKIEDYDNQRKNLEGKYKNTEDAELTKTRGMNLRNMEELATALAERIATIPKENLDQRLAG